MLPHARQVTFFIDMGKRGTCGYFLAWHRRFAAMMVANVRDYPYDYLSQTRVSLYLLEIGNVVQYIHLYFMT